MQITKGMPIEHPKHGFGMVEEVNGETAQVLFGSDEARSIFAKTPPPVITVPVAELKDGRRKQLAFALDVMMGERKPEELTVEQQILLGVFGEGCSPGDVRQKAKWIVVDAVYPKQ